LIPREQEQLEPLSRRERGRGEGTVEAGIPASPYPHPALRATPDQQRFRGRLFSRWEKEKIEPLSARRGNA